MKVQLKIRRFNPETDKRPWWGKYEVEVEPTDRVLDALHYVKWYQDGTLTLRRSCAHGICGSDAMRINGRNRLACKVLIKEAGRRITVEPILGLPVIKDLVVDMSDFFRKYEIVKPYLIAKTPPPSAERYQSVEDRELIDESTKCILCGACSTSCPSNWKNPNFLGPAALLKAFRYSFDSRDEGAAERLDVVDQNDGVWRCHTIFNCVEACPKDINITWHISQLKKRLVSRDY